MSQILDHLKTEPLLDIVDSLNAISGRCEWFRITRTIVAGVVADMADELDDAELSIVEENFITAGLLHLSKRLGSLRLSCWITIENLVLRQEQGQCVAWVLMQKLWRSSRLCGQGSHQRCKPSLMA